ncbi:unnamed protein product [Pleuronectes platessa]|uniref:Uncharacterized protein n=1 Tax=Pleuronectes platessa TaxID=8262 RepID=A0A9N7V9Q2_PLEPL|nr:unnamed protein product [Pleuronectes platessa]
MEVSLLLSGCVEASWETPGARATFRHHPVYSRDRVRSTTKDTVARELAKTPWKQPVMCDFPVQCSVMSRPGHGSAPRARPAERLAELELVHLLLWPCRIIGNEGSS